MAKMKIYEISRSLQGAFPDLKSKDLIKLLQENGFQVKSAQSSIEDDAISFLLNKFKGSAKKAEPVKETEEVVKTESAPKKEVKEKAEPKKKEEAKTEEKKEQTKKTVEETPVKEKTAEKETEKKEEKPEPVKKEEEKKEEPKKEEKAPAAQKAQEKKPVSENRPEQNNRRDNRDNRNGQGGRDNRDNRDRRDGGRRDNRDNRNGQGGRDNRGDNRNRGNGQGGYNRDNRNGQGGRDNRGDNRNRGNGQGGYNRDNRNGQNRDNRGGQNGGRRDGGRGGNSFSGIDAVKPEVKQSRAQRAKNDSRSAKQRHGRDRDREEPEYNPLYGPGGRKTKKKDPNRKGAFIKPEPVVKPEEPEDGIRNIILPEKMTIKELADIMKVQASTVIKNLFMRGEVVTLNHQITYEEAEEIALEYNCIAEMEEKVDLVAELLKEDEEDESLMKKRPPVVCVMGHVDHGKTSLLDAIRETNVTSREAGGITQHIGAYVTEINGEKITFLDTPGHEAFTSMRMRGAQATDIAILVVAADDGVMPQTVEAINHAKAAGVQIIVAVNKIDKPSANVERVKQELVEYELIAEDWGGDTVFVPVSAHTGEGIDQLLEMIILTAEVEELKANPDRLARGVVIEAKLDKGRGPVATILVQKGTLHVGDNIAVGAAYGKIRAMMDDRGRRVKEALPSTPVEILGLHDVPDAGEIFMATENDKEARNIAETYVAQGREKLLDDTKAKLTLDGLFSQIQAGNIKELNIIVKADVQGSVEAVKQSLLKLTNEEVAVRVIHAGVGAINESDVSLASASNAIIIGFNVRPDNTAKDIADREKVDVRLYRVIYDAIEDVEAAMKGMLDPEYEEKVIAHLEVRQTFKASGVGTIAGSYVLDGKIERGSKIRISREGELVFEGEMASLKRFKDDVKEVAAGYECGIVAQDFNDIHEGDQIEAYIMVEIPR
ncbi:translation initiation factor IF-2 [Roseburia sp. CAG:380]|nr:translation initiation factor IF-2 [Roseburia sp. CAG:380]